MIIDIRGKDVCYVHIGEKTFYIDDRFKKAICKELKK